MELSDSEKGWIEHSYKLEGGQTKYQNQNFVVGTQITPFKKVQQALLELQSRDNTRVELQYRLDKNAIDIKKLNRSLKQATDPLDKEMIEVEIEKEDKDHLFSHISSNITNSLQQLHERQTKLTRQANKKIVELAGLSPKMKHCFVDTLR